MRQYKCYYCKQLIEEEPVEFLVGKVTKRAHQECRKQSQKRKAFYSLFLKVLDIPTITDKKVIFVLDTLNKQGYSWDVMYDALLIKQIDIRNNFSKGFPYILAILKNQLPFSYKKIQNKEKFVKTKIDEEIGDIVFKK